VVLGESTNVNHPWHDPIVGGCLGGRNLDYRLDPPGTLGKLLIRGVDSTKNSHRQRIAPTGPQASGEGDGLRFARSASASARSRRTRLRSLTVTNPATRPVTPKATTNATQSWSAKALPAK
jgi:hypothetical protein